MGETAVHYAPPQFADRIEPVIGDMALLEIVGLQVVEVPGLSSPGVLVAEAGLILIQPGLSASRTTGVIDEALAVAAESLREAWM